MSNIWNHSNDEDLEEEVLEVIEEVETEPIDSGYITVRRITYEKVTPAIKVKVGENVPAIIINDVDTFENLLSKGAIVERDK